jgi:hypothetical protein
MKSALPVPFLPGPSARTGSQSLGPVIEPLSFDSLGLFVRVGLAKNPDRSETHANLSAAGYSLMESRRSSLRGCCPVSRVRQFMRRALAFAAIPPISSFEFIGFVR